MEWCEGREGSINVPTGYHFQCIKTGLFKNLCFTLIPFPFQTHYQWQRCERYPVSFYYASLAGQCIEGIHFVKKVFVKSNFMVFHIFYEINTWDWTAFLLPYDVDQYYNKENSVLFSQSYNMQTTSTRLRRDVSAGMGPTSRRWGLYQATTSAYTQTCSSIKALSLGRNVVTKSLLVKTSNSYTMPMTEYFEYTKQ